MLYYSKEKIEKMLNDLHYTKENSPTIYDQLDELKDDNLNIGLLNMCTWIAIATLVYMCMWLI